MRVQGETEIGEFFNIVSQTYIAATCVTAGVRVQPERIKRDPVSLRDLKTFNHGIREITSPLYKLNFLSTWRDIRAVILLL